MSENARKPPFSNPAPETSAPGPGATGIFGVVSPEPVPPAPALPAAPVRSSLPPIVVHEVTVQAAEAANPSEDDALQRLMRSEAAPRVQPPAPVVPAAAPMPFPVPAAAPAQMPGEFTQLLSTLQVPAFPAVAAAPTVAAPHPVTPSPVMAAPASAAPTPMPAAQAGSAEEELSFTRLFEALGAPAAPVAAVPPQPAAAREVWSSQAAMRPGTPEFFAGGSPLAGPSSSGASASPSSAGSPVPAAQFPLGFGAEPAPAFELSGELEPVAGRSPSPAEDPASFTQLFAALGQGPRPEPSQAADYPPLRAESQPRPGAPPNRRAEPAFGAPWQGQAMQPPPVSPARPAMPESEELQSLTQLLQALEGSGTGHAGPASAPEALFPSRGPGHSGATVAFTPPESVQRAEARGPIPPAGPGDFTRVLQTSALRESGIGSQAAAARSTPEPPPPSAAPVHAAPAPLPPWAAAPVPHVPQLPQLAHVNSGGAGLHVHTNLPSYPHAAFSASAHPGTMPPVGREGSLEPRRGRMPVLLFVLLAIIVILVGVLVAVLLHR